MNKTQLVNEIAKDTGLSKVAVNSFLESMLKITIEKSKAYDKIVLPGFGTFSMSVSKERKGINPSTLESIIIPEKRKLKFRPSKECKNL
jgi:DNA-binding protein HU-beta